MQENTKFPEALQIKNEEIIQVLPYLTIILKMSMLPIISGEVEGSYFKY